MTQDFKPNDRIVYVGEGILGEDGEGDVRHGDAGVVLDLVGPLVEIETDRGSLTFVFITDLERERQV